MTGLSVRGLTIAPQTATQQTAPLTLEDVSFSAPRGAVTALLGGAGAGKTVALAGIAGVLKPLRGAVFLDGVDVTAQRAARRGIGLLPPGTDLGAERTLAAALRRVAGRSGADAVPALMADFGLSALAGTKLRSLSHGQGFGALAACRLLARGDVLLVDDAGTGLDTSMRDAMLRCLMEQAACGRSVVFATRDTDMAMQADHLVLLRAGQMLQSGTPAELYAQPRDAAAARLTGAANVLHGVVRQKMAGGFIWAAAGQKFMQAGAGVAAGPGPGLGRTVTMCVRPEHVTAGATANTLAATITRLCRRGPLVEMRLHTALGELLMYGGNDPHWPGQTLKIGWAPEAPFLLGDENALADCNGPQRATPRGLTVA
jgi:ABC-type multidrug transport system ATPase subunit